MRSRSHRLPISDPHDDWVDGSWTVDCVCGVNFDDGEEMVNCDECGVWVHTRCSRYVKSEKLFACDKCKIKNSTRNDSEETEVAQLLVELPTKTLRMDNPYPPSSCPPRRPFRLWTDMPMEERVHVQGIPGGDPAIFGELSSVFGPQLWKCTGYVPKKFNFQYREFPSWEEKQDVVDVKGNEEKESVNTADKGADVLFSLSKENFSPSHTRLPAAAKNQVDGGGVGSLPGSDENKKLEGADSDVRRSNSGEKKDRNLIQPIVIHSSKSKKEDLLAFKDRIGKKKAMFVEKDVDAKKRAASASKTVLTISSDAKQLEFCEDKGPVILDSRCGIRGNFLDTTPTDSLSGGSHAADRYVRDSKNNLASGEHPPHILTADVARPNSLVEAKPKEGNADSKHETPACIESSLKPCDGRGSSADFRCVPTKEEVCANALHNSNDDEGISAKSSGTESQESKPFVDDSEITTLEMMKSQKVENPNGNVQSSVKVKVESDVNTGEVSNAQSAAPTNKLNGSNPFLQHAALWTDQKSENVGAVNNSTDNIETSDHKAQDILKSTEVTLDCQKDKVSESPTDLCQLKALSGVSDSSTGLGKSSSEHKQCAKHSEDSTKTGSVNLSPSMALNQRKVPVGKLSSTSLPTVSAKSSDSDNCKPASGLSNIISAKQRGISDCTVSKKRDYISADLVMDKDGHERPRKKDYASADAVRNKDGHERPKKISEELPKPDVSSVSKELHSSKSSTSNLKRTVSDSKDHSLSSSNKTSLAQSIVHAPDSVEAASALLSDGVSHAENGLKASNTHQKGEKVYHSSCQPSSKLSNALPMNPPAASNSPATLSDEELALLLHQELNSSPRVPRVPRMRHAGSLPQLPSPTATSMLMKRTSNSGGKDHNLAPRGKSKDLARDGSRSSRELDDDTKKIERVTSPDQKTHDSARPAYPTTKKETDIGRSTKGAHSGKRSVPTSLTTTACSGPSSSTEANEKIKPSTRNGRHINSDDNIGNVGRPAHCTLPALLAEIMGEGKRMTYEELCNAVLPHWPNLRKHNGERYAYSSHSQAVLDCLRNRHEWARLVDRGPKTNPTRKKRRTDADPSGFESEDNECSRERNAKDVDSKCFDSHPEEFPKGKRKARKRRRLALDGRGIKDIRRRRKADVVSDVDDVSFSDSSDESIYSEDEIQGVGACPVGNEASASSDEVGTMS